MHHSDVYISITNNKILLFSERSQCFTDGEFSVVNITYDNFLGQFVGRGLNFTAKVVVCQDGVYGSLCDVNWDQNDANVFCNSIGLGGGYCK